MMLSKQAVELHKIVCPFLTFKCGTEQEVLHDMRVAPWKSQICILTSDRTDLPYCREILYFAHYLRSGVNDVFVGWHCNGLLLNEDFIFFFNHFRTSAKLMSLKVPFTARCCTYTVSSATSLTCYCLCLFF
jgi:hypothetical protein